MPKAPAISVEEQLMFAALLPVNDMRSDTILMHVPVVVELPVKFKLEPGK